MLCTHISMTASSGAMLTTSVMPPEPSCSQRASHCMSLHVLAKHRCQQMGHIASIAVRPTAVERHHVSEAGALPKRLCLAGTTFQALPLPLSLEAPSG